MLPTFTNVLMPRLPHDYLIPAYILTTEMEDIVWIDRFTDKSVMVVVSPSHPMAGVQIFHIDEIVDFTVNDRRCMHCGSVHWPDEDGCGM
jgi:hypothetical protein